MKKFSTFSKLTSLVATAAIMSAGATNGLAQSTSTVKPSAIPELNSEADMLAYCFDNTKYIGIFAYASSEITAPD